MGMENLLLFMGGDFSLTPFTRGLAIFSKKIHEISADFLRMQFRALSNGDNESSWKCLVPEM